jgi:HPt (histidine-containing phosphotransfer) domain-containing protein
MDFHEAFRDEGVKIVADIEKAISAKNNHELGQQAHKLKGSALTIGYPEIAATTLKMEQLSKEGHFEKAAALFPRLKKQMLDIDNVMVEYFSRRSELQKKEPKKAR